MKFEELQRAASGGGGGARVSGGGGGSCAVVAGHCSHKACDGLGLGEDSTLMGTVAEEVVPHPLQVYQALDGRVLVWTMIIECLVHPFMTNCSTIQSGYRGVQGCDIRLLLCAEVFEKEADEFTSHFVERRRMVQQRHKDQNAGRPNCTGGLVARRASVAQNILHSTHSKPVDV